MALATGWETRTVLVWMVALLALFSGPAAAQLSPGPLSGAHADLDGPTKCVSCHEFGVAEPRFKCADCHEEIRVRLEQKRGYHAKVADADMRGQDCAACHMEHNGRDYKLVYFPKGREGFDHGETGYALHGSHSRLQCNQCHNADRVPPEALRTFKVQDPTRTLLGLSQECLVCHTDEHRGQLGGDCGRCHTFDHWNEPRWFDHRETSFPLTGKHSEVKCAECHRPAAGPEAYTLYEKTPAGSCQGCHEDPHAGAFAARCDSCHTTAGWRGPGTTSDFDHSKSGFPLTGKHLEVTCRKCHGDLAFNRPLAHARCNDCHTDDPHKNQFAGRADGGDCAGCHNEDGFKPATFGRSEHQRSSFPLEGKHTDLECAKCHKPEAGIVQYRIPHEKCEECHADPHGGQFAGESAAKPGAGRCESCHVVEGFLPSTFSSARHEESRFPLAGSHRAVACGDCHKPMQIGGSETARFHFDSVNCAACHESPHGNQFQAIAANAEPALQCSSCHTERLWRLLREFDHGGTRFPLQGAHQKVACLECHRSGEGVGVKGIVFAEAPRNCQGCHEDPHRGQFDEGGEAHTCDTCHTIVDWHPTRFDHEKYSRFSLAGAHKEVACRQCHLKREAIGELETTIYRGTPTDCSDCHGPDYSPAASGIR